MNTKTLARQYGSLTALERFQLIVAATSRDDAVERQRLTSASKDIHLWIRDDAPYLYAFHELSMLTYIEVLDEAAHYLEMVDRARELGAPDQDDHEWDELEDDEEPEDQVEVDSAENAIAGSDVQSMEDSCFRVAMAAGYMFKTKMAGWKLFCESLHLPPWFAWDAMPGYDRLQVALAMSEQCAFDPEGMLRWLNDARTDNDPALAALPLTAEREAEATTKAFKERVTFWGGSPDELG